MTSLVSLAAQRGARLRYGSAVSVHYRRLQSFGAEALPTASFSSSSSSSASAFTTSGVREGDGDENRGLPRHAVRLEGLSWTQGALIVVPILHGRLEGSCGGLAAAEAIRSCRPQQVLVELCARRYADCLAIAVLGLAARPPPRLDLLGNVHGGLLAHELAPVLLAAREVGASVVPVDRSGTATRSRVAQRLGHPKLLQGLLRYGALSLRKRGSLGLVFGKGSGGSLAAEAESLRLELQKSCPAAHEVLVEERCSYMTHQVRAAASASASAASASGRGGGLTMLICGALHCGPLVESLRRDGKEIEEVDLVRLARRSVPVWPLYALAYGLIPGAAACYVVFGAWTSFVGQTWSDE